MSEQKKIVIAIDGTLASGKGTLAQKIAAYFGYGYMDTGALYRGVAKTALDNGLDTKSEQDAEHAAILFRKNYTPSIQDDPSIRAEAVSKSASEVAAVQAVRDILFDLQKDFASKPYGADGTIKQGAVLDGRDIGTVIVPDARVKLFITAAPEIRAKRRFLQLEGQGKDMSYDDVLQELYIRDGRDTSRPIAPTIPAKDAIVIDTSEMNAQEVYEKALTVVKEHLF